MNRSGEQAMRVMRWRAQSKNCARMDPARADYGMNFECEERARTFTIFFEFVPPATFDEFLPQQLLETLLLAGLDELLHDCRPHSVILLLPLLGPPVRK